jgi:hypothetical protein
MCTWSFLLKNVPLKMVSLYLTQFERFFELYYHHEPRKSTFLDPNPSEINSENYLRFDYLDVKNGQSTFIETQDVGFFFRSPPKLRVKQHNIS